MKKATSIYSILLLFISLSFFISSCEKDEDDHDHDECIAEGTWDLQYVQYENQCIWSCTAPGNLPDGCMLNEPYDAGCSVLTVSSNGSWIVTDESGWTASGNWSGNCNLGEQISFVWDGTTVTGTIMSMTNNELILREMMGENEYQEFVLAK